MIKSTCIYLEYRDSFLMMNRNKKEHDINAGKWIGIGGKFESNESEIACAIRETKEETGLDIDAEKFHLHGQIDFYVSEVLEERIWVYVVHLEEKPRIMQNEEGTMSWVSFKDLMHLPLWDGDRIFLKNLCSNLEQSYRYEFYYDQTGCLRKDIERVTAYE